jgi:hypothetical protein
MLLSIAINWRIYFVRLVVSMLLDREQSLGRKEGLPTTHQETKYAMPTRTTQNSAKSDM